MREKAMFICRWVRLKYLYVRFRLEKDERKKGLRRLDAKEAYKTLYC